MPRPREKPQCLLFPLVTATLVILSLYYTTVFVVIDGWIGLNSAAGFVNAVLFSCLATMTVITYIMAMLSDPGNVPSFYKLDHEDPPPFHEFKKKNGDLRFCQKCCRYKPPRAHHCHICKKCILRMDHHCIWIGNCVGHRNLKIFCLLLLYSLLTCLYSSSLLGCAAYNVYKNQEETGDVFKAAHVAFAILLCPLIVGLTTFFIWHAYLIIHNMTTIEFFEGVRARGAIINVEHITPYPYDLGAYENFVSLFGRNAIGWICPIYLNNGSGLYFRTTLNCTDTSTSSNV